MCVWRAFWKQNQKMKNWSKRIYIGVSNSDAFITDSEYIFTAAYN